MMTTEQIIKALECFHHRILKTKLAEKVTEGEMMSIIDALALIRELQAHNENLKRENKYLRERLTEEMEHKEDMRVEGEWIGKTDYAGYGYYCSNCNAVFTGEYAEWIAKEHKYCPKCGAKMKGE